MLYELEHKIYKNLVKPVFFAIDPEKMHDGMTFLGSFLGKYGIGKALTGIFFDHEHKSLEQRILGIRFKSPIGLSAGFDKDAKLIEILPYLSFGYSQVGSVTLKPYGGNPKPRLYRLPNSKGLVVYYGLKNVGVEKIIKRLKNADIPKDFPYSISIAKTNSKKTNTDSAGIRDYYQCYRKIIKSGLGSFHTINISCPNTFGGEPFTTEVKLDKLLSKLRDVDSSKPLFVKMPINLAWKEFDSLLKVAIKHKISGVIIGNLNKDYSDKSIKDTITDELKGGISGKPTWELSNKLIAKTYQKYKDKFIIVGAGGVSSAEDAYEKIKLGASLVQLITGMIYEGPQVVAMINKGLVELLKKDGYSNISEAVGENFR